MTGTPHPPFLTVIFPSREQELATYTVGTLNIGDMGQQSDAGNVKLPCVFSPGTHNHT